MHAFQKRLLEFVSTHDLGKMTLREIGELLDKAHPQKIKHHLMQLEQKGLIEVDRSQGIVRMVSAETTSPDRLITIPILGSASCGTANVSAEENIEGYLKISTKLIDRKTGLFALKAVGNSMNKANIRGMTIEDGDYVIVDSEQRDPRDRDYVLAVTEGLANIKLFLKDELNEQIILISESTQDFPPIVIHPDDVEFLVCGSVTRVIKKPVIS